MTKRGELLPTIEPDVLELIEVAPESGLVESPARASRLRSSAATTCWLWDRSWHLAIPWVQSATVLVPGPRTVFIEVLASDLRLRRPIPVAVDDSEPGCITAWSYDFEEYGTGEDDASAIEDFRHALADLYFTLKAHAAQLGPSPARQWAALHAVVIEP